MKRLGRWLFNLAAGLSIVLLPLTAALWIRSYFATDWATFRGGTVLRLDINVIASRGDLAVNGVWLSTPFDHMIWRLSSQLPYDLDGQWLRWSTEKRTLLGVITWGRSISGPANRPTMDSLTVMVPYWLLAVLTFAFPGWIVAKRLRDRQRTLPGHCQKCGYDLRATPERCPECGAIPSEGKGAVT
jgi:hypothetical protein